MQLTKELSQARGELGEALEQQAAASEILRVISSSPTDIQPVFDTIVASALRLCGAHTGAVYRFDGGVGDYIRSPANRIRTFQL